MSIKERVVRPILHRVAHVSGGSAARAERQRVGRILMFHGVDPRDHPVAVFEAQLRYLARRFKIVPLADIVQHVSDPDGRRSVSGEIALTFDDGLRNNYTLAYPVLRRLLMPATFFVCPALIEQQQWQWAHEVAARLMSLGEAHRAAMARNVGAPSASAEGFKQWMKTLPPGRRRAVEEQVRAETRHFVPTADQRRCFDPMTWDELRRLDPGLITVGSHTLTHPILTTLSPPEAAVEIHESRRQLELKLGRPVEYFCYPDGSYDASIVRSTREAYRAAVTADAGFVRAGDELLRLRRIQAAAQLSLLTWRLHRPTA